MNSFSVPVEVNVQDVYTPTHSDSAPLQAQEWQNWCQQWLEVLSEFLPPAFSYELSLRFTDDEEIQALNSQYRLQNKPTDVLAFAALEVECPQPLTKEIPLYLGDIVISVDTAHRQAQERGHSKQIELAWLASHGLLHLLGWDHPDEESLREMLNQQTVLLESIGLVCNNISQSWFADSSGPQPRCL